MADRAPLALVVSDGFGNFARDLERLQGSTAEQLRRQRPLSSRQKLTGARPAARDKEESLLGSQPRPPPLERPMLDSAA